MVKSRRNVLKIVLVALVPGCNTRSERTTNQQDSPTDGLAATKESPPSQSHGLQNSTVSESTPQTTENHPTESESTDTDTRDFTKTWEHSLELPPRAPAVFEDAVLVPSVTEDRSRLINVRAGTGERDWNIGIPDGDYSSLPKADGGILYCSGHAEAIAVSIAAATRSWSAKPDGTGYFVSQPLLLDETLLVPASNPNNPSAETTEKYFRLYAFEASSGDQSWSVDFDARIAGAATTNQFAIVQVENGRIVKINKNGTIVWERSLPRRTTNFSPSISGDTIYANGSRSITALHSRDGSKRWESQRDGHILDVVEDGVIYDSVEDDTSTVLKLSKENGEILWENQLSVLSNPAVGEMHSGVLYLAVTRSPTSREMAGLVGIDSTSGTVVATHSFGGEYRTQPVVSDNSVFIGHGTTGSGYMISRFQTLD